MAKQFIVARGQIEKGREVLAKQGDPYKPKNAAEEKRLLDAGVITEVGGKQKAEPKKPVEPKKPADPVPPAGGAGGGEGEGDKGAGGEGGQGNA